MARPPRVAPDGRLHYGWDERLRLGKGRVLAVSSTAEGITTELVGRFDGYERGSSVLRFSTADGTDARYPPKTVWSVRDVG